MKITEVSVVVAPDAVKKRDGVLAFVKVVFEDCFAVRDIKLMEGVDRIILGMPSRKMSTPCEHCGQKTARVDKHCVHCGHSLEREFVEKRRCYMDVAFPINSRFRQELEIAIVKAYNVEVPDSERLRV